MFEEDFSAITDEKGEAGVESCRPGHVAIIMDGNGRWASQRGRSRSFGHRQGIQVAREIIRASVAMEVATVTLFAFSSENRQRPRTEISELTKLFSSSTHEEIIGELIRDGVRIRTLGDVTFFGDDLQQALCTAENRTRNLERLRLNVAINYGGRWDIANAVLAALNNKVLTDGLQAAAVERLLPDYLGAEEVDLLIRTGGECRLSNFLLWQSAYAELYFTDTLWPDFDREKYRLALEWYAGRKRRFGLTPAQVRSREQAER